LFHPFWQAKFAYHGSILSSNQFTTAPTASKFDARYENDQK
jgi:hypothetical protein